MSTEQRPKASGAKLTEQEAKNAIFIDYKSNISETVQMERIFKTSSGNIYEVTGLALQLELELQPDILIMRNGDTY
jgi:hypothetical protein